MRPTTPKRADKSEPHAKTGRRTTIAIDTGTRDRLRSHGIKSETYDDLVNRLLDELDRARERLAEVVEFEPVKKR